MSLFEPYSGTRRSLRPLLLTAALLILLSVMLFVFAPPTPTTVASNITTSARGCMPLADELERAVKELRSRTFACAGGDRTQLHELDLIDQATGVTRTVRRGDNSTFNVSAHILHTAKWLTKLKDPKQRNTTAHLVFTRTTVSEKAWHDASTLPGDRRTRRSDMELNAHHTVVVPDESAWWAACATIWLVLALVCVGFGLQALVAGVDLHARQDGTRRLFEKRAWVVGLSFVKLFVTAYAVARCGFVICDVMAVTAAVTSNQYDWDFAESYGALMANSWYLCFALVGCGVTFLVHTPRFSLLIIASVLSLVAIGAGHMASGELPHGLADAMGFLVHHSVGLPITYQSQWFVGFSVILVVVLWCLVLMYRADRSPSARQLQARSDALNASWTFAGDGVPPALKKTRWQSLTRETFPHVGVEIVSFGVIPAFAVLVAAVDVVRLAKT